MSMTYYTDGSIDLDGVKTGLKVGQDRDGNVVYSPEASPTREWNGTAFVVTKPGSKYRKHTMPHARYSLAHDHPGSGVAGRSQFESDLRDLLERLA